MDLSFQEKSVWASLVSIVVVFGYHFYQVFGSEAAMTGPEIVARLAGTVVVIIVIEIVLHILIAVINPEDTKERGRGDERDSLVAVKAYRNAYIVLLVAVLLMIGYVLTGDPGTDPQQIPTPAMTANLLLFCMVIAEIINYGSRIYFYRRGF
jgi:uncharacterized membrane protein